MEKCEFSYYNEKEEQMCSITKEKCIYDWLFPDAIECYETTKIYPEYSYIYRRLKYAEFCNFDGSGYGAINIKGYHIAACKKGFTINHGKEIYSKMELIKKLLKK